MVYPEYLFDCPSIPHTPAPVLSEQQCAELDAFKAHFGHRGYAVPNSIGGMTKAPLTEREMMFLVSVPAIREMLTTSVSRVFLPVRCSRLLMVVYTARIQLPLR